VQNHEYLKQD